MDFNAGFDGFNDNVEWINEGFLEDDFHFAEPEDAVKKEPAVGGNEDCPPLPSSSLTDVLLPRSLSHVVDLPPAQFGIVNAFQTAVAAEVSVLADIEASSRSSPSSSDGLPATTTTTTTTTSSSVLPASRLVDSNAKGAPRAAAKRQARAAPAAPEDRRRKNRTRNRASERARREDMNISLQNLRKLVPECNTTEKLSKLNIIDSTVDFLQKVLAENEQMRAQLGKR